MATVLPTPDSATKIKHKQTPFLTQTGVNPIVDNVLGYVASIEGWLWNKNSDAANEIRDRLNGIKTNHDFKHLTADRYGQITDPLKVYMRRLDKIALDVKDAAGNQYECTPETENVAKTLDQSNAGTRQTLDGLIDTFQENSQNDGAGRTQTIVQLPPPNRTYRIDRESLSAEPAPRYWTYRIQVGGATYGGIEMQTNVLFNLASVRQAMHRSLASSAPGLAGFYVRIKAPQWLTDILTA